jgi:membrane-bound serine protease (ClpP class)
MTGPLFSCLFALLLAVGGLIASDQPVAAGPGPAPAVSVACLEVDGVIDDYRERQFKRQLEAALKTKPTQIVVKLTTDGGHLGAAMEMLRQALKTPRETQLVAFIDNRAYSAGALIAYGMDRIYLTSDAYIGDIGVITISTDGKIEYLPEKIESPVRALLRQAAQHNGWNEAKLQKMTARNQELWQVDLPDGPAWVIADDLPRFLAEHKDLVRKDDKLLRGEATAGFIVLGQDRLLTYTAKEAIDAGMATALVKDLDEVYRLLGTSAAQVQKHEPTRIERIAETLGGFAPLLAALAVLMLILEFKMPSGGLWLIGAGIAFVLFLGCQYFQELAGMPEVLLMLGGVALVLLDIFVLPTGGLLTIGGACALVVGLILAFVPDSIQFQPSAEGWGAALVSGLWNAALALVMVTIGAGALITAMSHGLKIRTLTSEAAVDGTTAGAVEAAAPSLVGHRGTARTLLRPTGYVLVDGRDFPATVGTGELVQPGGAIEVVEARFGELIVRPVAAAAEAKA